MKSLRIRRNTFLRIGGMKCDTEHLWELADEMLETIRCQEEALKWYKGIHSIKENNAVLPSSYFVEEQNPKATQRLMNLSAELRNSNSTKEENT